MKYVHNFEFHALKQSSDAFLKNVKKMFNKRQIIRSPVGQFFSS